ncbi:uncharacterized protein METZ01_LOCUS41829 [marine metagenome]|uniref:Uncharacterized protein n=1 Tax=marine metagenome TaxID=408172 RepID=A0A381RB37_9ZZZZ
MIIKSKLDIGDFNSASICCDSNCIFLMRVADCKNAVIPEAVIQTPAADQFK